MYYRKDSYPANWLDDDDIALLMLYFFSTSFKVSKHLAKNPQVKEESLTDIFINELSGESKKLNSSEYPGIGRNNTVFRFVTEPNENKTGADIGIIINTRNYDIDITKALLIQCKKLHFRKPIEAMENYTCYGEPEYNTTVFDSRSYEQARKLLSITPASFFWIYNTPLPPWSNLNIEFLRDRTKNLEMHSKKDEDKNESIKDEELDYLLKNFLGIRVLPSTTLLGSFQSSNSRVRTNSSAKKKIDRINRYTIPFHDFMVNDLLQGKIGDSREKVIATAAGENPNVFNPRYTLFFEIIDHY